MGIADLERKLAKLSLECENNDVLFSNSNIGHLEVVEESPFKLDMEIAGGSRPRTSVVL